jgi:hypothetical protein
MAHDTDPMAAAGESFKGFFDMQGEAMRELFSGAMGGPLTPEALSTITGRDRSTMPAATSGRTGRMTEVG